MNATCPSCGKSWQLKSEPGQPVFCPACSALVPGAAAAASSPAAATAAATRTPFDPVVVGLRSRIEEQLAHAAESLAGAEAVAAQLDAALRVYEGGEGEGERRSRKASGRTLPDLQRRIAAALESCARSIAELGSKVAEAERRLEKAHAELAGLRAKDQQLRETRLRAMELMHLSGDLQRRLERLHELMHAVEGADADGRKAESGLPDAEKRLDAAAHATDRSIRECELRLAHQEDQLAHMRGELMKHRAHELQLRTMELQLRQARQVCEDLDRNLTAVAATVRSLSANAKALLPDDGAARADAREPSRPAGVPAAPA